MVDDTGRLKAAKERLGLVGRASPDLFAGFARIAKVATADGEVFSAAQRELLAVSIAVGKGCPDCILYHVDAAIRLGATERGLTEALEVAIEMGGGPSIMYAGQALEAYRALAPK